MIEGVTRALHRHERGLDLAMLNAQPSASVRYAVPAAHGGHVHVAHVLLIESSAIAPLVVLYPRERVRQSSLTSQRLGQHLGLTECSARAHARIAQVC